MKKRGKLITSTGGIQWLMLIIFSISLVTSTASSAAELKIENELLLELRLEGEKLGLDILGYQRGREFLLSLDELTYGLGFPITVDGEKGLANGWYISEQRGFSLDLKRSEVVSGGKKLPLADGEVVIFQGGLYVEAKALEKWFPLQLSAVVRELYLDVEPTELLPIQKRFKRRERVSASSGYQELQYPLQESPYQFFGPHMTKLSIGYSTVRQNSDSEAKYDTNYALLSRGDLGWMTSTLALAGQSDNSLNGARLKLERTAFDGPMSLNHVEVGDVGSEGFRGFLLRGGGVSKALDERFADDTVDLEGSQLPDWDVELYQNGQLIMTQTTGQTGRYLFEDVALLFGENRFELKFFGPYGEIETREEYHYLGQGMLTPGRVSYDLAATQSGRTVFGVNEANGAADRDSGLYSADFNLGLSRNLTAGAGVNSVQKNGERIDYINAGFGLATSRLYGSARYFHAPDAQDSVSTSLRTRLGNTSLNLGYIYYYDEPDLASSPNKWQGSVDITSSIFTLPLKFTANTLEQEESTRFDAVLGSTVAFTGSGRFSSSIFYDSFENRVNGLTTKTSQTRGQSNIYSVLRPWTFRLGTGYRIEPDSELLVYSANSTLRMDRDTTLNLGIRKDETTEITHYQGGINWQLDQALISARVSYDSNERWVGLMTLSTTLVHQPDTLKPRLDSRASIDSGSVEVRVFTDDKGAEGEPHAGVGVKGVQANRKATSDETGVAYLSRMPAHRQVDIEIDESTLTNAELRSNNPGVSIISRPGSYAVVKFPIIRTAELEGYVVIANGKNGKPVNRALVQLKTSDGEIVAQRRTAFDGFFLFEGIEPGVYQISLEESLAKRLLTRPGKVTVVSSSGVIRGLDFTLRAVSEKLIALSRLVPAEESPKQLISGSSASTPAIIAMPVAEVKTQAKQTVTTGKWFVQLGAYGSREKAQDFWNRAKQSMPEFQGKTPRLDQYRNMIRLLVGPGQGKEAASQFCQQLKAGRVDCFIRELSKAPTPPVARP
jgi:hypothetical protein